MKSYPDGMKAKDIIDVLVDLSYSQGSYGRLLWMIRQLEESDIQGYDELMDELERQRFVDAVDLVSYIEG